MWDKILGSITGPVATYFTRRSELKQARFEAELKATVAAGERQAALISQGLTADMNWEMEFAQQAKSSWKDEYVLAVLSIPAILCFIPKDFDEWQGGAFYVSEGFAALQATPLWYQILFCSVFAATFGIRWWRRKQTDT